MKKTMTAVLGLTMLVASAFAAQDAPKTDAMKTDTTKTTTHKAKKHSKKMDKTTGAPASTPAPAASPSK